MRHEAFNGNFVWLLLCIGCEDKGKVRIMTINKTSVQRNCCEKVDKTAERQANVDAAIL
jgi:hypothetical protein